jgi:predicted permease
MNEWMHSVLLRLRAVLRRRRLDDDLRDEIAFHVAMREAQLGRTGTEHAETEALRRFGNRTRIAEDLRAGWALAPRLSTLGADLRHALRGLRRHPAFAIVVILTLGLGIGINTATFSIVNAVLLRPLPFSEPERLVTLEERLSRVDFGGTFSPPDFFDVESEQQSFENVAAYVGFPLELSANGEGGLVDVARVSAALFPIFGVTPLRGRVFGTGEDRPGVDVAVLSERLWQSRFNADPRIVGRSVMLDRRPYTVIGVMPSTFEFPQRGIGFNRPADVWMPLATTDALRQARGSNFGYRVVARLKRSTSIEQARAELEVLSRRITDRYSPAARQAGTAVEVSAIPLTEAIAGRVERPLLLLLAAVGLVLLMTCANIANLVLSRSASRSREVALRMALGSSRARLLQLLLAEAVVLSAAGALAGVAIAMAIVTALPVAIADLLPTTAGLRPDTRVLAFSAGLAIATSLIFALIPFVTVESRAPGRTLQEEGARTTPGLRRHRVQAALVVSTVVLACVMLAGAGLFIRSFTALMATETGFEGGRVLTAAVALPRAGYRGAAAVHSFHESLLRQASSLPGVRSAALTTDLPLERYERRALTPEGFVFTNDSPRNTNLSWIRGPYFATLGIRLRGGRVFTEAEDAASRNVVIVNARLAGAFWPGQDAVGKRLRWGTDGPQNRNPWLTIVGVVDDVADGPIGVEPYLHAYEPFVQFPDSVLDNVPTGFGRQVKVAVSTDGEPLAVAAALRGEFAKIDPYLAIRSLTTMDELTKEVAAPRRFTAMTLGAFAAGSLLLAGIGLYGLLAFRVAERRREIAVRLALGAKPPAIVRMVVAQGLRLVAIGLALGVTAAFAVAGTVDSFLYRTERHDAVAFGAVPFVLLAIALIACALPAYRAARVESLTALRADS